MEEKGYKEDSTKGKSILSPRNYKGDVNAQAWLDSRVLATLSNWLEADGRRTRYISECIRIPLEILVDHLVRTNQVERIEDTAKARRLLSNRYQIDLNRGNKGRKNELHNRILSDKRMVIEHDKRLQDIQRPMDLPKNSEIEELTRRAVEAMKGPDKSQTPEEVVKLAKEQGSVIVKEGMTEEELLEKERKSLEHEMEIFDSFEKDH